MRRREALGVIGALAAVAPLVGACRRERKESVLIAGSSTMQKYLRSLVEAFEREHPEVFVELKAGGASAGLLALKRGSIDVATMTRDVTPTEDDLALRNYLVARDGVAILVHPSNPVRSLKLEQLRAIYEGSVANWKDVGGPDARLVMLTRGENVTTEHSLRDMLLGGDLMPSGVHVADSAAMTKAVAEQPGAIGFESSHHVTPAMRTLAIDGVELSRLTVLSGRYPLSRSFYLALYGTPPPPAVAFASFVLGPKGRALLEREGLTVVY